MASPVVVLENVALSFGSTTILENVNIEISKGESLVVIGPSGQGKTVLLKLMAGILTPTRGRVLIEGNDLATISEGERRKLVHKMGMLFQKNALFDSMTSAENISFPLREVSHADQDTIENKIDYFLREVDILHARNLYPDEISGGMQKRLGIARALALDPEIIFYDDPTAGLDPITSRRIVDLICRLREEKSSTVVAVTNDMHRAYQMADRIAMVVDREVLITGSEQATKDHPDPRVHQFIRGELTGPLMERQ